MLTRDAKRCGFGFTLVELLVVVAIITILFSILLPALGAARDMVKTTACANGFRQSVASMNIYGDDNNSYLPIVFTNYKLSIYGAFHYIYYVDLLMPYINPNAKLFGGKGYYWASNPFICPSAIKYYDKENEYGIYATWGVTSGGWTEAYSHGGVSYLANCRYYPKKFHKIDSPSRTALACDSFENGGGNIGNGITVTTSGEGGTYWYGGVIANCHGNGLNWLFADGHVKRLPFAPTNTAGSSAEFDQDWRLQRD